MIDPIQDDSPVVKYFDENDNFIARGTPTQLAGQINELKAAARLLIDAVGDGNPTRLAVTMTVAGELLRRIDEGRKAQ